MDFFLSDTPLAVSVKSVRRRMYRVSASPAVLREYLRRLGTRLKHREVQGLPPASTSSVLIHAMPSSPSAVRGTLVHLRIQRAKPVDVPCSIDGGLVRVGTALSPLYFGGTPPSDPDTYLRVLGDDGHAAAEEDCAALEYAFWVLYVHGLSMHRAPRTASFRGRIVDLSCVEPVHEWRKQVALESVPSLVFERPAWLEKALRSAPRGKLRDRRRVADRFSYRCLQKPKKNASAS